MATTRCCFRSTTSYSGSDSPAPSALSIPEPPSSLPQWPPEQVKFAAPTSNIATPADSAFEPPIVPFMPNAEAGSAGGVVAKESPNIPIFSPQASASTPQPDIPEQTVGTLMILGSALDVPDLNISTSPVSPPSDSPPLMPSEPLFQPPATQNTSSSGLTPPPSPKPEPPSTGSNTSSVIDDDDEIGGGGSRRQTTSEGGSSDENTGDDGVSVGQTAGDERTGSSSTGGGIMSEDISIRSAGHNTSEEIVGGNTGVRESVSAHDDNTSDGASSELSTGGKTASDEPTTSSRGESASNKNNGNDIMRGKFDGIDPSNDDARGGNARTNEVIKVHSTNEDENISSNVRAHSTSSDKPSDENSRKLDLTSESLGSYGGRRGKILDNSNKSNNSVNNDADGPDINTDRTIGAGENNRVIGKSGAPALQALRIGSQTLVPGGAPVITNGHTLSLAALESRATSGSASDSEINGLGSASSQDNANDDGFREASNGRGGGETGQHRDLAEDEEAVKSSQPDLFVDGTLIRRSAFTFPSESSNLEHMNSGNRKAHEPPLPPKLDSAPAKITLRPDELITASFGHGGSGYEDNNHGWDHKAFVVLNGHTLAFPSSFGSLSRSGSDPGPEIDSYEGPLRDGEEAAEVLTTVNGHELRVLGPSRTGSAPKIVVDGTKTVEFSASPAMTNHRVAKASETAASVEGVDAFKRMTAAASRTAPSDDPEMTENSDDSEGENERNVRKGGMNFIVGQSRSMRLWDGGCAAQY
ncbi:MAG: hypothetical protein M1831_000769 [Alyxoria varia]|nr:MAG: hypothetical protein M1831_000769 [Alyxoria varia]